jgi:hypothetical protein
MQNKKFHSIRKAAMTLYQGDISGEKVRFVTYEQTLASLNLLVRIGEGGRDVIRNYGKLKHLRVLCRRGIFVTQVRLLSHYYSFKHCGV